MIYIDCGCEKSNCGCYIAKGKARSYRAGQRARRKGRSRKECPESCYAYDWTEGWLSAGSPRVKRREAETDRERMIKLLKSERRELAKRISLIDGHITRIT